MKYVINFFLFISTLCASGQGDFQFDYPSSSLVEFSANAKEKYVHGGPIEIALSWRNTSSKTERILICKEYGLWGASGKIWNQDGESLQSDTIRTSLISQAYSSEDLKVFEVFLEPNEIWTEIIDFRYLTYFDAPYGFEENIQSGKYTIRVYYYGKQSKAMTIELY
ncbi:MAG: hypothetical protein KTR22_07915 [Flavobacteriaceae bacterium]|nr:hypothetical protein [Flavobacteriaceae bacterium]